MRSAKSILLLSLDLKLTLLWKDFFVDCPASIRTVASFIIHLLIIIIVIVVVVVVVVVIILLCCFFQAVDLAMRRLNEMGVFTVILEGGANAVSFPSGILDGTI